MSCDDFEPCPQCGYVSYDDGVGSVHPGEAEGKWSRNVVHEGKDHFVRRASYYGSATEGWGACGVYLWWLSRDDLTDDPPDPEHACKTCLKVVAASKARAR